MRFMRLVFPCLVAFAVALGAMAAPASAADTPTWHQGQSVGYGIHLDIGSAVHDYLALITGSMGNTTHFNELNISGTLDSWEVDTVSAVTSSYYTLSSQSAEGLKLHVAVNVTEQVPEAGTFHGSTSGGYCALPLLNMVNGTIAVNLDATVLATGSGTTKLNVSDLAYVSTAQNATVQAKVAFTGFHLPSTSLNLTACTVVVSYDNPSYTLTVDTQDQVRMLFQPAWDYFDFPISDNETWWSNSNATVGATLKGTIDVQGLSSQDEQAFFDNLTKSLESSGATVSGLSAFPIDLAKVSISLMGAPIVSNGVVTDYPVPVQAQYRATASAETLSDGNQYPTFLITDASYACPYTGDPGTLPIGFAAVYAPDFPATGAGMIVGYQLVTCLGGSSVSTYELKNTSPAQAQQNISRTESEYQVNPPAQTNALVNFFTQAPYLGLLLIAAVVVVVAALLLLRRRHRPSIAPPGAPPATPPPPVSPPPGGPGAP